MQKIFFFLILSLVLFSCETDSKFTINGDIKNARGNILYLEHVGVSKTSLIDSVKLDANGHFKFSRKRSDSPNFYRLKLNKQFIDLAIDSTETIKIQADSASFAKNYTVEGSENCSKIKELSNLRDNTATTLNKLDKAFIAKEINQEEYQIQQIKAIETYKNVAKKYILDAPGSTVAYYALLQTINGLVFFDTCDKEDNRFYSAVATQWDFHYPDSEFSRQVKNLSLQGIKILRADRPLEYTIEKTIDVFDVNLPTITGAKLQLSKITNGKVTLLEFCTYMTQGSPEHNMLLAGVYEKYKDKGFQIYQVSLDSDEHAWKNAASNLPWMCVRDPQSVHSEIIRLYNVESLPTGFILDKDGEIVQRVDSYKNLESEVIKILK